MLVSEKLLPQDYLPEIKKAAPVYAAFKIMSDVASYRLRRMEMANLIASISIILALQLAPLDAAIRILFAFLLNILVYLHNDYVDIEQDLLTEKKNAASVAFLYKHLNVAYFTQWGLLVVLVVLAIVHDPWLLVGLTLGGGICFLYSQYFKQRPVLDVLAMYLAGMFMPLVAFPFYMQQGWILVLLLGGFAACFELIQVMRDYEEDKVAGVKTTAVVLGMQRAKFLFKFMIIALACFSYFYVNIVVAVAIITLILIPIPTKRLNHFWLLTRLNFGCCWLYTLARLFFYQSF